MSKITERALSGALGKLLEDRPLDRINIKDITDLCGLTRNTFYYHFHDVYDLLSHMFRTMTEDLMEKYAGTKEWDRVFLDLLTYFYENKKMIYHVYNSISHEELELCLTTVVGEYAARIIDLQTEGLVLDDRVRTIITQFYKDAFVGATIKWIKEDMHIRPEDLADIYDGIFKGTVRSAVTSAEKVLGK